MIERPRYMAWLNRWREKDVIKVLTGMRRCGKSTILSLYQQKLLESGVALASIQSINFEQMDRAYPREAQALYDYIVARLAPGTNYVFLDEVQHVEDFERVVDGLYVRDDVDLYITGSNAKFLSGELATLLTGRYVEVLVQPLSFAEYRSARLEVDVERAFNDYLTYGGLPYVLNIDDPRDIMDYLGGVFNTIVLKDIAQRNPRMDMRAFDHTASFLADNVGNITSCQRISRGLAASGRKISTTTVGEYIEELKRNFLLFEARRFDLQGGGYLNTLEKYYLGDLGFRFWLLGKSTGDLGHRVENAIYLELLHREREVCVGKWRDAEVDFVTLGSGGPHYYQVALSVLDETVLDRELAPLQALRDNYPKTLLTLDRVGSGDHGGIEQVNIIDWLLGE